MSLRIIKDFLCFGIHSNARVVCLHLDDFKMLDSVTSKFEAMKSMQLEVVAVSLVGSIFEFIEKLIWHNMYNNAQFHS